MSQRHITSRDIARALNISQSTVSRALSRSPRVSEETRAAVQREAERQGYQPNAIARSLSTQQSKMIGVVTGDVTNPFYPEVLEQLSTELAMYGRRLLLFNAGRERNADDEIPFLLEFRVDGVIFTAAAIDSRVAIRCREAGIPLVLLNRRIDDSTCNVVESNNYAGGQLVGNLFVDGNHRRMAFISGREDTSTSRDRERGFMQALNMRGISQVERRVSDYTHDQGYRAAEELLVGATPPTAIFCCNDVVAIGALDAARDLGAQVPDQLSIVGYDDIPMASWPAIRLTTVRQPRYEMVQAAVEVLIRHIEDHDAAVEHRIFPPELALRHTFKPLKN